MQGQANIKRVVEGKEILQKILLVPELFPLNGEGEGVFVGGKDIVDMNECACLQGWIQFFKLELHIAAKLIDVA